MNHYCERRNDQRLTPNSEAVQNTAEKSEVENKEHVGKTLHKDVKLEDRTLGGHDS